MAEAYSVLGQSDPTAASLTDIYTVPGSTEAVVSTISVANRSTVETSFRISVAPAGVADDPEHYLYYDIAIGGNDTFVTSLGVTLATTDKIRVYATLATLSFSVFGTEIT
jgi:hypothetical protein